MVGILVSKAWRGPHAGQRCRLAISGVHCQIAGVVDGNCDSICIQTDIVLLEKGLEEKKNRKEKRRQIEAVVTTTSRG